MVSMGDVKVELQVPWYIDVPSEQHNPSIPLPLFCMDVACIQFLLQCIIHKDWSVSLSCSTSEGVWVRIAQLVALEKLVDDGEEAQCMSSALGLPRSH